MNRSDCWWWPNYQLKQYLEEIQEEIQKRKKEGEWEE
tara:strand:+ start:1099 stop:1209 length:111 start_codon:yes stop_codon:yes gene_type:complete